MKSLSYVFALSLAVLITACSDQSAAIQEKLDEQTEMMSDTIQYFQSQIDSLQGVIDSHASLHSHSGSTNSAGSSQTEAQENYTRAEGSGSSVEIEEDPGKTLEIKAKGKLGEGSGTEGRSVTVGEDKKVKISPSGGRKAGKNANNDDDGGN